MKNIKLAQGIVINLLLTVSTASAENYPAAYFQPKVIYIDEAQANTPAAPPQKAEQQTAADSHYPAASFQPKVIYSAPDN